MDSIIWRHSEIERGVAAGNADSRRKAKAGEVRRRLVVRTAAAELNRFDELIRRFVEMAWTQCSPSVIR